MSIEISVRIDHPLSMKAVFSSAHATLSRMLQDSSLPELMRQRRRAQRAAAPGKSPVHVEDSPRPVDLGELLWIGFDGKDMEYACIDGMGHVWMLVFDHRLETYSEEDAADVGVWVSLQPYRDELSFLLMTALAIAAAREAKSRILDDALLFRGGRFWDPDALEAHVGRAVSEGTLEERAIEVAGRFGMVWKDA